MLSPPSCPPTPQQLPQPYILPTKDPNYPSAASLYSLHSPGERRVCASSRGEGGKDEGVGGEKQHLNYSENKIKFKNLEAAGGRDAATPQGCCDPAA